MSYPRVANISRHPGSRRVPTMVRCCRQKKQRELPVRYSAVSLQTKKIKGLHENDFIMATKIDRIFARTATA